MSRARAAAQEYCSSSVWRRLMQALSGSYNILSRHVKGIFFTLTSPSRFITISTFSQEDGTARRGGGLVCSRFMHIRFIKKLWENFQRLRVVEVRVGEEFIVFIYEWQAVERFSLKRFYSFVVYLYMRRFTSTVPARGARALNRAISNSCLWY